MKKNSTLSSCYRESPFLTYDRKEHADSRCGTIRVFHRDSTPFLLRSIRAILGKKEDSKKIHDIFKVISNDARLYHASECNESQFLSSYALMQVRLLLFLMSSTVVLMESVHFRKSIASYHFEVMHWLLMILNPEIVFYSWAQNNRCRAYIPCLIHLGSMIFCTVSVCWQDSGVKKTVSQLSALITFLSALSQYSRSDTLYCRELLSSSRQVVESIMGLWRTFDYRQGRRVNYPQVLLFPRRLCVIAQLHSSEVPGLRYRMSTPCVSPDGWVYDRENFILWCFYALNRWGNLRSPCNFNQRLSLPGRGFWRRYQLTMQTWLQARALVCPISLHGIEHPVVTPYGHLYEKDALLQWLSADSSCPLTRLPLKIGELIILSAEQYNEGAIVPSQSLTY